MMCIPLLHSNGKETQKIDIFTNSRLKYPDNIETYW